MKTGKNKKKLTKKPKRRRMTFSFESPEAEGVILMGDFNHWNAKVHPMKKDKDGVWRKIVMVFMSTNSLSMATGSLILKMKIAA